MFDKVEINVRWGHARMADIPISRFNFITAGSFHNGPVHCVDMHQNMTDKNHEWYAVGGGFTDK